MKKNVSFRKETIERVLRNVGYLQLRTDISRAVCRIKNVISITNKTNIFHSHSKAPPFVIVTNMEMSKCARETW